MQRLKFADWCKGVSIIESGDLGKALHNKPDFVFGDVAFNIALYPKDKLATNDIDT